MEAELELSLRPSGSSYVFRVPAGFVTAKTLKPFRKYRIKLEELPDSTQKTNTTGAAFNLAIPFSNISLSY